MIPSTKIFKVPRGKERKRYYTNALVATGAEFTLEMTHDDVIQRILESFSHAPRVQCHLGFVQSPLFYFMKAVDDQLTMLNQGLKWDMKMVRHVTGQGPFYIQSFTSLKNVVPDFESDSDESDESEEEIADLKTGKDDNSLPEINLMGMSSQIADHSSQQKFYDVKSCELNQSKKAKLDDSNYKGDQLV